MAPLIQMRFEESQVRRALVRVFHADGDTAGTAFFVTPDRLVTCFHVIASRVDPSGTSCEVSVVLPGGEKRQAVLDEVASAPQLDIAVFQVRCEGTIVLPCGLATEPGQAVWTSGFHKPDQHAASDVPTNAWLGGRVVVVFEGPPANRIPGLTLESATIRPGSSGAPLIDRDTGAVIGIVDAEHFHQGEVFRQQITIPGGSLDGYAIALDGAANEHPPLAALVEENRRSVPAFGRYLNGPGARHLCRLQAEGAVRELTNSKYFNPATYTPRQNLTTEIHRFVRSPKKLMPVVGYTGVGKTTSLCHLAGDLTEAGWAVVLLRGVRVAVGTNLGLDGDIAKILTPAGDSRPYDLPFFLEAISPAPLVVLLDALNEVVYQTDPELRAWWGGTIDWLARSNARALVTSRLQTWEGLKGDVLNDLFFHPANPDPGEGRTAARTPPYVQLNARGVYE